MRFVNRDFVRKTLYGIVANWWNLSPSPISTLALPELQVHVLLLGDTDLSGKQFPVQQMEYLQ